MKFFYFFLILWVIFAFLDPDPHFECGSGSSNSNSRGTGSETLEEIYGIFYVIFFNCCLSLDSDLDWIRIQQCLDPDSDPLSFSDSDVELRMSLT